MEKVPKINYFPKLNNYRFHIIKISTSKNNNHQDKLDFFLR